MKKTILALAVVSIAAAATAEVKLSGRIGVQLDNKEKDTTTTVNTFNTTTGALIDSTVTSTSKDTGRATFNDAGSEIVIDASEQIGAITAYAHTEFDYDGGNNSGTDDSSLKVDEVRVGLKGSFGDVQLGDVASACDDLSVGDTHEIIYDGQARAGCGDGYYDDNEDAGIKYTGTFGPVKAAVSYRPDEKSGEDELSVAVQGTIGPVKAALAHTSYHGSSAGEGEETIFAGVEGTYAGVNLGLQYHTMDGNNSDGDGIELNAAYNLPKGKIYAGYGTGELNTNKTAPGAGTNEDKKGFMVGYTHNLSSRTIGWVEYGSVETDTTNYTYNGTVAGSAVSSTTVLNEDETSWSIGLRHSF
jgi:predicted porin